MKLEKRSAFGWPATAAGYAPCKNGLVVHYDGSNQGLAGKPHSACRAYWKATRRFHMGPARGWLDIGYSFGVCPHGIVMEGRGWQRQQAAQPGGNTTWTSCTFMSGDGEKPTGAQVAAFKELRAWLRGKGLGSAIRGHRDFISTSCPGSILYGMVKSGALKGAVEEDDMPLSKDDVEKVAAETVKTLLTAKYNRRGHTVGVALETAHDGVLQLLARDPSAVDVDEDAIAAAVLAGLTPERIAAAIPAEFAADVATELGKRLTPKE